MLLVGIKLQCPSVKKGATKLSFNQFRPLIQGHLAHLTEAQHSLHLSWAFFKKNEDVLPVQCKRAFSSLEELNKCVREFCEFFQEVANPPVVYAALRYRFIIVLYLIEEQSRELIDLIDSYCEVCITSTKDAKQQR